MISIMRLSFVPLILFAQSYLGNGTTPPNLPFTNDHPYLFFDYSERDEIATKRYLTSYFNDWYNYLVSNAQAGPGSGADNAVSSAFVCLMTDSADKYLPRAKYYVIHDVDSAWTWDSTRDDNAVSNVGENAAVIYDFIARYANDAEKDSMVTSLKELMRYNRECLNETGYDDPIWPWFFPNGRSSYPNNHHWGHAAATALLAITLNTEHDSSAAWLQFSMMWLDSLWSYYVRNAPYYEGPTYGDVMIRMAVPHFLAAYKHACGINAFNDDDVEIGEMIHQTLVVERLPDGNYYGHNPHEVDPITNDFINVTKDEQGLTMWRSVVALIPDDSLKKECAWALGDPENDDFVVTSGYRWHFYLPYILWDYTTDFLTEPRLAPTQKNENDEVIFRNNWTSDASFLHLYGRKIASGYHGSSGLGHFDLHAHGQPISVRGSYWDGPEKGGTQRVVFKSTNDLGYPRMSNTIIADGDPALLGNIDGESAIDGKTRRNGITRGEVDSTEIEDFFASSFLDGATVRMSWDFTGPIAFNPHAAFEDTLTIDDVQGNRSVLFVKDMAAFPDNEYFVVADEVISPTTHDYDYVFHPVGVESGSGNITRTILDSNSVNQVRTVVYFATPEGTLQENPADYRTVNFYGDIINYNVTAGSTQFLVVYYPYAEWMAPPTISRINIGTARGYDLSVVQDGKTIHDVAWWQYTGPTIYDGFWSDGLLLMRREVNDQLYYFYAKDATVITNHGDSLICSSAPLDVVALKYNQYVLGEYSVSGVIIADQQVIVRIYSLRGTFVGAVRLPPGTTEINASYAAIRKKL